MRRSSAMSVAGATVSRKEAGIEPRGRGAGGGACVVRGAGGLSEAARAIATAARMSSNVITIGGAGEDPGGRPLAPIRAARRGKKPAPPSVAGGPLPLKKHKKTPPLLRAPGR